MVETRVQFFVKFFSEEAHADQFLEGRLFMRKLKYFQKLESRDVSDGRPDANEGIVSWHQPDRIEIQIEVPGIGKVKLGPGDLGGPLSISKNVFSEMHVFCMTALSIPDPSTLSGDQEQVRQQLQSAIQFDPRCLQFGPHAVVVKVGPFIKQLRSSLDGCGHWYRASKVEYYDQNTFHGDFSEDEAPFRKQIDFEYQQEYRVCILSDAPGDEPMTFDVGSIKEFSIKVRSEDINGNLRINVR